MILTGFDGRWRWRAAIGPDSLYSVVDCREWTRLIVMTDVNATSDPRAPLNPGAVAMAVAAQPLPLYLAVQRINMRLWRPDEASPVTGWICDMGATLSVYEALGSTCWGQTRTLGGIVHDIVDTSWSVSHKDMTIDIKH